MKKKKTNQKLKLKKKKETTEGGECGTVSSWWGLPLISQFRLCSILLSLLQGEDQSQFLRKIFITKRLLGKSYTPRWCNDLRSHHWRSGFPSSTTPGRAPLPSSSDGPGQSVLSVGYPQRCAGYCLTTGSLSTLLTWIFISVFCMVYKQIWTSQVMQW